LVSNDLDLMAAVADPGALFALGPLLADRKVGHIPKVMIANPLAMPIVVANECARSRAGYTRSEREV
jgi:hypothetical protein